MSIEHESPDGKALPSGQQRSAAVAPGRLAIWLVRRGAALLAGRTGLAAEAKPAKAKSVIQIWLAGGPSHLDTFDPKPDAGNDYCGPLNNPIATNVDGIRIGELLPLLAKQADKYSIIRSMTHGDNGHETAAYLTQTGRRPGDRLVYPCAGAVVSLFKGYDAGYKGLIPPYIVLTQSQGRFSEAGFLGPRYKPFATGGDPAQQRFMVEGVVSQGISRPTAREAARACSASSTRWAASLKGNRGAGGLLPSGGAGLRHDPGRRCQGVRSLRRRPTRCESDTDVNWGTWVSRTRFGQCCLAARRLVERGVPYITINFGGWDTHTDHFKAMRRIAAGPGHRAGDAACRPVGARPVGQHDRLVLRRVRPHAQDRLGTALERRPQPLRQGLLRAGGRGRIQGGTRRRLVGRQRAKKSRIARSTRAT